MRNVMQFMLEVESREENGYGCTYTTILLCALHGRRTNQLHCRGGGGRSARALLKLYYDYAASGEEFTRYLCDEISGYHRWCQEEGKTWTT